LDFADDPDHGALGLSYDYICRDGGLRFLSASFAARFHIVMGWVGC